MASRLHVEKHCLSKPQGSYIRHSFGAIDLTFPQSAVLRGSFVAVPDPHPTRRRLLAGAAALIALPSLPQAARAGRAVFVDRILVEKSRRRMLLQGEGQTLKRYRVDLGFSPRGHKRFQGDGRTPEGRYFITHRNPYSRYHLSLGVSYPAPADRRYAARHGRSPGGDIFIHGRGPLAARAGRDWTAGCIAVTDAEMEEIYRLVAPGTPIDIRA